MVAMSFKRTVIGSFPSVLPRLGIEDAIKWAVNLQLKHGVEVITDGEQRGSLIDYFEQIPGLGRRNGKPAIIERIKPLEDPTQFTKIVDCKRVFSYLRALGRGDVGVKVTITGPITLGFTYAMGGIGPYSGVLDKTLYLDLVNALIPIIETAAKMGCYIQVDEPGLTGRFLHTAMAEEILSELFKEIHVDKEVTIHVCGSLRDVPGLYDMLLRLDLEVLSLAFSGEREKTNFEIISKRSLEDYGKKLGAGFISNVKVESVETAFRRLRRIAEKVGVENIAFVHPDCGFRETPPNIVEEILATMKKASEEFIKSLQ